MFKWFCECVTTEKHAVKLYLLGFEIWQRHSAWAFGGKKDNCGRADALNATFLVCTCVCCIRVGFFCLLYLPFVLQRLVGVYQCQVFRTSDV